MTGLERIVRTVAFESTDRVPVVPQIFAYAGVQNQVDVAGYVRDGQTAAECQIAEWRKYGHDAVFAFLDVSVETEAMGAQLDFYHDRYPTVRSYPVASVDAVASMSAPDPLVDGRMPELLRAAEILRERTAEQVAVVGAVCGPLTTAVQLMGAEAALECAIDFPDVFESLLDLGTETAIRLGCALLDRGIHVPLVFDPSATPEFVPPQFFREYELPRLEKVCGALKRHGAAAVWFHAAGNITSILPYVTHIGIGIDICNFDYPVAATDVIDAAPALCLDGNIRSFAFLGDNTKAIEAEAAALVDTFAPRGGFILSSGCEIPPESSPAAVAALVAAAKNSTNA